MPPFVLTDCCCSTSVLQSPKTSGMKTREDSTGLHIRCNQDHVLVVSALFAVTHDQKIKKNPREREYIQILGSPVACPDAQSFLLSVKTAPSSSHMPAEQCCASLFYDLLRWGMSCPFLLLSNTSLQMNAYTAALSVALFNCSILTSSCDIFTCM